ncbi:MAG: MBL fold metallo-hydrolase [Anaerolineae bacterium]|nr:MBL fold metallo-hydrolase [Anaerolineae bacterium]
MGFEILSTLSILPDSLALWGLGQSGVVVTGPDAVIVIDPCLSTIVDDISGGYLTRAFPPPIQPDALTGVDYILCTHDHADHFDPRTVVPMLAASPGAKVVLPGWALESARSAGIDSSRLIVPTDSLTLPNTSLRLTVVPSAHYGKDYDPAKGYRWLGFLIEWNGVTLYHAGDTIIYDGYVEALRALPTPDLALVPINGRDWFR